MKYLENQTQFEQLIGRAECDEELPFRTVIWFSAQWCGPCKRVEIDRLMSEFQANWLKCDIDMNDYTAGYCDIRSIPSFLLIEDKKILGKKTSANTSDILAWLYSLTKTK